MEYRVSFFKLTLVTIFSFFIVACAPSIEEDKLKESTTEEAPPLNLKPIELTLSMHMDMPKTLSMSQPLTDLTFEKDETKEAELRAIDASVDKNTGKLTFKFAKKKGRNMVIILCQKDTNGKPKNCIYLKDFEYVGNGDNSFHIRKQKFIALAENGVPLQITKESGQWYAMCIYDNPLRPHFNIGRNNVTMDVAGWDGSKSLETPISYLVSTIDDQLNVSDIQIPFISDWTPIDVQENNFFVMPKERPVKLNMQGVLLRIEIHNKSSFPLWLKYMTWETNVIHANISYDFSPSKLPAIDTKKVNYALSWKAIEASTTAPKGDPLNELNTLNDRIYQKYFMQTEDRTMMGKSFIGIRNYLSDTEIAKIKAGDKTYIDHNNLNRRTIPPQTGKLGSYIYLWGMPITDEEVKKFNDETIPMTAVYTVADVAKNETYISTNEKGFDNAVLNGKKPAPTATASLDFVNGSKLRDNSGKTFNGVVPIKVELFNRDPCPLEYMCQTNALLNPKDKPVLRPTFADNNTDCWVKHNGKRADSYFFYDYITDIQPDHSKNPGRLRIKHMKNTETPIPNYHIPNREEIQSVFCQTVLPFGKYYTDHNSYGGAENRIKFSQDIFNIQWNLEQIEIEGRSYRTYSFFRQTNREETNILSGHKGSHNLYTVALRGLWEGNEWQAISSHKYFYYSPALGIYLYSVGDNEFFIECIPLGPQWVKRFNHNGDKLADYIMSAKFWNFARNNTVYRSVAYVNNYNNAGRGEKWGPRFWRSNKEKFPKNDGEILWSWGFEWSRGALWPNNHGNDNIYFHSSIDHSSRTVHCGSDAFGVILFHDKLWERNNRRR